MRAKLSILATFYLLSPLLREANSRFDFTGSFADEEFHNKATASAIFELLDEYFMSRNLSFTIYTYRSESHAFLDIINEIGRGHENAVLCLLEVERDPILKITAPGVALMDDHRVDDFLAKIQIDPATSTSDFKLLVYCRHCYLHTANKYVQLLIDEGHSLRLSHAQRFTNSTHCRKLVSRTLNLYDKAARTWQRPIGLMPKVRNYNGCSVNVSVRSHVWLKYRNSNMYQVDQMFNKILRVMAELGNFTVTYKIERVEMGSHRQVSVTDEDFKLSETYQVSQWMAKDLEAVLVFCEAKLIIAVTEGVLYSQYEKLLLPFDTVTWILFFSVFATAFVVIFVLSFAPQEIRNIVYGEGVNAPTVNVVSIFFGIGQTRLPLKTFARVILILFIWFCLIFRTAHQSKLFEYITSEPRRPHPRLADHVNSWNWSLDVSAYESLHRITFQIHSSKAYETKVLRIFQRMIDNQQKYCDYHNDGSANLAFLFNYYEDFLPVKERCRTAGHILDDISVIYLMSIKLQRNNEFFEVYHEIMMRIIPAGIPQKLYKDITKALTIKLGNAGEDGPKVLSLDDLGFGFIIVLVAGSVATVCFLCELAMWPVVIVQRRRRAQRSRQARRRRKAERTEAWSAGGESSCSASELSDDGSVSIAEIVPSTYWEALARRILANLRGDAHAPHSVEASERLELAAIVDKRKNLKKKRSQREMARVEGELAIAHLEVQS